MRKAFIFKSKYIGKVASEAKAIFMYWEDALQGSYEYVNYGNQFHRYFMKERVMDELELMSDYGELSYEQLIDALKLGADYGVADWETIFLDEDIGTKERAELNEALFQHSELCPDYTVESLLDPSNFARRDGRLYSKTSYHEAQHLYTWFTIFEQYEVFEPIFIAHYKEYLRINNFEPRIRFKE